MDILACDLYAAAVAYTRAMDAIKLAEALGGQADNELYNALHGADTNLIEKAVCYAEGIRQVATPG